MKRNENALLYGTPRQSTTAQVMSWMLPHRIQQNSLLDQDWNEIDLRRSFAQLRVKLEIRKRTPGINIRRWTCLYLYHELDACLLDRPEWIVAAYP